ncbi:hypothetical protein STEG23_013224 [Scotinomys teguina]
MPRVVCAKLQQVFTVLVTVFLSRSTKCLKITYRLTYVSVNLDNLTNITIEMVTINLIKSGCPVIINELKFLCLDDLSRDENGVLESSSIIVSEPMTFLSISGLSFGLVADFNLQLTLSDIITAVYAS